MCEQLALELKDAIFEGSIRKVNAILRNDAFSRGYCLSGELAHPKGPFNEPTALTLAVDSGHIDLVKNLLELEHTHYTEGIPDFSEISNSIPLDYSGAMVHAAVIDRFDIIQLLAEFRIFQDRRTGNSFKDILLAAKEASFDSLETYLIGIEDEAASLKGWKGHNLMNLLILHQCPTWCIQLMMDHGIRVNGWDLNGFTPLRCAVLSKNLENVQFLLEKGADVFAPQAHIVQCFEDDGTCNFDFRGPWYAMMSCSSGPTTVMYAASVRNHPILKLMLESAPTHIGFCHNVNSCPIPGAMVFCGNTVNFHDAPISFAIHYGNIESISLLLQFKPAREYITITPAAINLAASLGKADVFVMLLQNTNINNIKKSSLLSVWSTIGLNVCGIPNERWYREEIIKFFFKNVGCTSLLGQKLFDATCSCSTFDFLFEMPGFNVNAQYKYEFEKVFSGSTLLIYCCYNGNADAVRLLLRMGAKVDMKDICGVTAIMQAARQSHVECLKLLMDAGADLAKSSRGGATVFSFAMLGKGDCLEVLLKSGEVLNKETLKLKTVHRKAAAIHLKARRGIRMKCLVLLMQFNVFEWDWCSLMPSYLRLAVFAAVILGVSPGQIKQRSERSGLFKLRSVKTHSSPLLMAYKAKSPSVIRYLLANLYFLPNDYKALCTDSSSNTIAQCLDEQSVEKVILEPLLFQPQSLHHWSFLTISKLITIPGSFSVNDRNHRVNSLDLPKVLKDELKFKRNYSQLCFRFWSNLGRQSSGDQANCDDLVIDGRVLKDVALKKCSVQDCECNGFGQEITEKE